MTTFATMRTRIAKELGDPDDSRWTSEIKTAIVQAIEEHEHRTFWFTQDKYITASDVTSTLVADTEYYAFPTSPDLVRLDSLRIIPSGATDPYPLTRIHWERGEEAAAPATLSTGTPIAYSVRGEKVRLYPIPAAADTLYWAGLFRPTTEITTASADNATNVWMVEGANLIRNRAKEIVARGTLHDGQLAGEAEVDALQALMFLNEKTTVRLRTGRNRPSGPGMARRRLRRG